VIPRPAASCSSHSHPRPGGNVFHSGGRQFASQDDPGWKILADWVIGKKL
jgi:hypothetical protein